MTRIPYHMVQVDSLEGLKAVLLLVIIALALLALVASVVGFAVRQVRRALRVRRWLRRPAVAACLALVLAVLVLGASWRPVLTRPAVVAIRCDPPWGLPAWLWCSI